MCTPRGQHDNGCTSFGSLTRVAHGHQAGQICAKTISATIRWVLGGTGDQNSCSSGNCGSENGNNILVPVLLLSFIPYFLPDGVLPPEIAAFWNRAAMPTDPNVFPPS